MIVKSLAVLAALAIAGSAGADAPAPVPPKLVHVFTVQATLAPVLEVGQADGGRRRFIGITGGTVSGPRLSGTVLPGGGDWQTIHEGGLTRIEARYFLRAADGTVIEVTNPGVRTATPEVIERLARGDVVDPSAYYFRTTPQFKVGPGPHSWLERTIFVARGVRHPDSVEIQFFAAE